MQVYQTDDSGFYIGPVMADPDPLTPGSWLIPGGCVEEAPPTLAEGELARWVGNSWVILTPAPEPEPEPEPEPTPEELRARVQAQRHAAFVMEADPLFFKAQRGEATLEDWEVKVAEIRERFPYPDD